jgi:hypothetical protein
MIVLTALLDQLSRPVGGQVQLLPLVLGFSTTSLAYLVAVYLRQNAADDYMTEGPTRQLSIASLLALVAGSVWVVLDPTLPFNPSQIIANSRQLAVPIMGFLLLLAGWKTGHFSSPEEATEWFYGRQEQGTRQIAVVAALSGGLALIFGWDWLDLHLIAFPITGVLLIFAWLDSAEKA